MENCPCGSGLPFSECCGPILSGEREAPTALALMRSRYTAYAKNDIAYLGRTLAPERAKDFDPDGAKAWADTAVWTGLEVLDSKDGGESDQTGMVEFAARFERAGIGYEHREKSLFRRENGRWLYVDGEAQGERHSLAKSVKTGRNDPCPCGSGKKFKKCCGR